MSKRKIWFLRKEMKIEKWRDGDRVVEGKHGVSVKLGSEYGTPAVSAFRELAIFQTNIILHIIVLLRHRRRARNPKTYLHFLKGFFFVIFWENKQTTLKVLRLTMPKSPNLFFSRNNVCLCVHVWKRRDLWKREKKKKCLIHVSLFALK